MDETQRKARGHNFTPPKKVLAKIPALYATEDIPFEDKVIHLHYFSAGTDYYIAELSFEPGEDGQSGRWLGFGYARLASQPEGAEWGLIDITALEAVNVRSRQGLPVLVERDKWFEPQAFSAITEVAHPAHEPDSTRCATAGRQDPAATHEVGYSPPSQADEQAMACPQCHESAVNRPTTDLAFWAAHGLETPQWSHEDGSSLCPVIGERGYEPAQPVPLAELEPEAAVDDAAEAETDKEAVPDGPGFVCHYADHDPAEPAEEPDADTARLDPPASMQAGPAEEPVNPADQRGMTDATVTERGLLSADGSAKDPRGGLTPGTVVQARIGRGEVETAVTIHHATDFYGPRYVGETATGERCMFPPENVRLAEITTAEPEVKRPTTKAQAVIDGTTYGSIDPSKLDDAEFWSARATGAKTGEPQPEVTEEGWSNGGGRHGLFVLGDGVIIDDGPTERQISDWNIHNDHTDGLDFEAGS